PLGQLRARLHAQSKVRPNSPLLVWGDAMNTNRLFLCCAVVLAWGCGGKTVVPLEVAKLAITAPGKAVGPSAEMMVPTTGGKVQSADGRISIDVPAGALPASQMITIQ